MDLHLRVDHHYDATKTQGCTKGTEAYAFEEVHGAAEEEGEQAGAIGTEEPGDDSDEGGVTPRADARMVPTAKIKKQLKPHQMVDKQLFIWKWVVYADVIDQVKAEGLTIRAEVERRACQIWMEDCFPVQIYHTAEREEGTQSEFMCNWLRSGYSWAESKTHLNMLSLSVGMKRKPSRAARDAIMKRLREKAAWL